MTGLGTALTVTFHVEGYCAVKCLLHYGVGTVDLGGRQPTVLDVSKVKVPGESQQRVMELMSEAGGTSAN